MSRVKLDIYRFVDEVIAKATFQAPGPHDPEQPVECGISRNSNGKLFWLETSTVRLPCWLAGESISNVAMSLGEEATYAGRFHYVPTSGESEVFIDGSFQNIDLQLSSVARLPTELNSGSIHLRECKFRNGSKVDWNAWLFQGPYQMPISELELFNYTKQLAPTQAIAGALLQSRRRVAEQPVPPNRSLR